MHPNYCQITIMYMYVCLSTRMHTSSDTSSHCVAESVAVTVDEKRNNLMEFGRYVQEMLPKYVQQAQITHG